MVGRGDEGPQRKRTHGGQASGRLEQENRYKSLETLEKLPKKHGERSS
jgi:hypothetical protein